ncbi:HupE/UreJ family protein [Paracoccus methylarcula]|uniref:Urease accessory protein n=1 Tax=Paracoccus methylarcula TaxID=72022 RepID=A0A3R7M7L5_9RHOB|nr:HupE/UreJ family protein [Paracoccus methylarcula]RNF33232.1 urease accessory protein [Paracoccus methylarcula]
MKRFFTLTAAAAVFPGLALAHPGHEAGQFMGGLSHPIGGADHLLAMVALGLLAAQIGGRMLWALPAAFVTAMIAGGLLGWAGLPFAGVEPMILASVVILGALVAMAMRLPMAVLVPGVAIFGFAHGWAHGAEGPVQGLIPYAVGFATATMALHLLGIGIGRLLQRGALLRGIGGGTVLAGLALAVAG